MPTPAFVIAALLSCFVGYLAIVDPSLRQAFSSLAQTAITGYFAITAPQSTKDKDNARPEQD